MSAKSLNLFGPSTTKWRPCKVFATLNENHLLMANIFKFHESQIFGLMIMHMFKIRFACNIFGLWKGWFTINAILHYFTLKCYFLLFAFSFTQISKDYCQKSYNGFWGFLAISTTSQIFLIYTFLKMKRRPF